MDVASKLSIDNWAQSLDVWKSLRADSSTEGSAPTRHNGVDTPSDHRLPELAAKYQPSKVKYNYLLRCDHVFGPIRHRVRKMVEIGVQTDTSVRMWEEFFPNAEIFGIDIDEACAAFARGCIKIVNADQTDVGLLASFARENFGQIDVARNPVSGARAH